MLVKQGDDSWTGFVAGVTDGTPYRFYVIGSGSRGFKRDPYARELGTNPAYPNCDCLARDPRSYPWRAMDFHTPPFSDMVIYQLHVGVFYGVDAAGNDKRESVAKFLDVIERIPYLRDLRINTVQLLPIQEFPYDNSMGYNNLDYFSPEMVYQVEDEAELHRYLAVINGLLHEKGKDPLMVDDIRPGPNQLKVLVDLLHLNGIAVILDLVYNHAGPGFDDQSLFYFDRRIFQGNNDGLYFSGKEHVGISFEYTRAGVQDFLIRNVKFFQDEYHIDGVRYDQVGVIDEHGGWFFCQLLTGEVRDNKREAIQIAEYWKDIRELAVLPPGRGMGFDAAQSDRLRDSVRKVIEEVSHGALAHVNLDRVRDALYTPPGFGDAWRAVHCVEDHDITYAGRKPEELKPRLAKLAGGNDARSWYAQSRARFATAMLLTAPGIPLIFMGQEILEDKNWSDNPRHFKGSLIWWEGLAQQKVMRDFLEFTKAVLRVRGSLPALRGPNVNPYYAHNDNRVIAVHRWLEWTGADVVVIGTLREQNWYHYEIGLPRDGEWREVFNSDYYDDFPKADPAGNFGRVVALGPAMHGMPASARVTIPANGVIVLAK
jgi:1,4-alpha-glucan branching enzyme